MRLFLFLQCCFILPWLAGAQQPAASFQIVVGAGALDREFAVASFAIPESIRTGSVSLHWQGKAVPLQISRDGRASFVVEHLKRGESASYELKTDRPAASGANAFRLDREPGPSNRLMFLLTGEPDGTKRPLFGYQAEPGVFPRDDIKPVFRRGGYLHPLHTLSGRLVTDDFPPNHIHHHGVWAAWTSTEFDGRKPDFWNMGDGKGRVEFVSLDESWSGPVHAGFQSRHRYVDLTATPPVTVLHETWQVTVFRPVPGAAYWCFDLALEQQCATAAPLKLPQYRYGGVGVRGNWAWNGREHTRFLTSDGETDREKGNATRGRWCDMSGLVNGQPAGIAILGHPDNFRAPQPMRLHPTEPFFNFAPQQAGDMEIQPGQIYKARYRFVVHDGPPDRALLDRLWQDYANPLAVKITAR